MYKDNADNKNNMAALVAPPEKLSVLSLLSSKK